MLSPAIDGSEREKLICLGRGRTLSENAGDGISWKGSGSIGEGSISDSLTSGLDHSLVAKNFDGNSYDKQVNRENIML